jgi:hypothetical protein
MENEAGRHSLDPEVDANDDRHRHHQFRGISSISNPPTITIHLPRSPLDSHLPFPGQFERQRARAQRHDNLGEERPQYVYNGETYLSPHSTVTLQHHSNPSHLSSSTRTPAGTGAANSLRQLSNSSISVNLGGRPQMATRLSHHIHNCPDQRTGRGVVTQTYSRVGVSDSSERLPSHPFNTSDGWFLPALDPRVEHQMEQQMAQTMERQRRSRERLAARNRSNATRSQGKISNLGLKKPRYLRYPDVRNINLASTVAGASSSTNTADQRNSQAQSSKKPDSGDAKNPLVIPTEDQPKKNKFDVSCVICMDFPVNWTATKCGMWLNHFARLC